MDQGLLFLRVSLCITLVLVLFSSDAGAQTTVPGWRTHTQLPAPLAGHATVLLPTGHVLIAGGTTANGSATRASYLYSSADGTFRPTINQLITARAYHALVAVVVNRDVKVFAIGGFSGTAGNYSGEAAVEVLEHDAAQNNWRWRGIGTLRTARGDCRAAWDGGSYIIVTGGYVQAGGALRSGTRSTAAERINITTLAIEPIAAMNNARAEHITARITGDNGLPQILTAGGEDNTGATSTQILAGTAWDAIANPPLAYHSGGAGVGDPAGIARVFGGFDAAGRPSSACEWYDVKRGWRAAPRMAGPRARFDATLAAGLVDTASAFLAAGGAGTTGVIADAEIFHMPGPSFPNGTWAPFSSLVRAGSERRIAITGSNLPLVTGGRDGAGAALENTEIFQPLQAADIAFGDEEVGRRSDSVVVAIENTWLLPVRVRGFRIVGSAEFSFRGDTANFTIPAGGRRTLRAYFQPATPGERNGLLLFDIGPVTDTIRLSGRGIASQIAVINSPLDFGGQLIRTERTECGYVLRNNGTDTAMIDSIVIAPPGAFRLLSPLGRVSVPPGDSLRICVEFAPGVQGFADATATMHIAARSFPLQVTGRGVRRYLTASVLSSECDTVLFAPGAEISGFISLENRGDTVVHVDAPVLKSSIATMFRLANPALFPLDMNPGDALQIEVIFSPQRESQEVVTVQFPNNGDTATNAALCFVARSRYLSVSQSAVELGSLCAGDTATAFLTIENPGGFDPVELLSATIDPASVLTLSGFTPRMLGPREYLSLAIRYIPDAPGTLSGTLTIASSRGDVIIPVRATALPAVRFSIGSGTVSIGDTVTLPVQIQGMGTSGGINQAALTFEYDPRLLMPLDVVSTISGPQVDGAGSELRITGGGKAAIDVRWLAGPVGDGATFGIVCEVLRGDGTSAPVAILGESSNGLCIARSDATLTLLPPCAGDGGSIRTEGAQFMTVSPVPASKSLSITLVASTDGALRVELLNTLGNVIEQRVLGDGRGRISMLTIPVEHLPAGSYLIRALGQTGVITSRMITITR